ncbi:MutS family DNA mismatch repair protein [Parabacteroides bouchesdurhonensis]|uniref:MutS family DNA mismatch repair protein n=1 Tax=Parabacteroides bouchesdurhonensis TaxID=1936995 RepID=UPI000E4FB0F4|nr:MutS family DNA mismatch repair protein [Parabacteroides bouchesdurhonensis]RHJ93569.1 DNA mismatch repair protein MutS [Bacteroides sp. AM07-16]
MEEIYNYYKENIEAYTKQVSGLQKKIHLIGSIRLALALGAIVTLWLLWGHNWLFILSILFLYAVPFAILMLYHNKLFNRKTYAESLIQLNTDELKGLDYDFSAFDGAEDKSSGEHDFSLDLDLFGQRSLFQSINRTVTLFGRELLANWFMNPLTDKDSILKRQEAVKELAPQSLLRQHFYVTGIQQKGSKSDLNMLASLTNEETIFANSFLWKVFIWIIPALWILIIIGCAFNLVSYSVPGIYLIICLFVAYFRGKQVNDLYNSVDKMNKILSVYSELMKSIEGDQFQSAELVSISNELSFGKKTASQAIKQLSLYIGGLDQRFSFAGIILNLFYLRDTRHAILLEKWKLEHADDVPRWINALAHFDALCSLGNFSFNHPDYIYPDIADTYFCMEGKALGHPLLNRNVCVKNDIDIKRSPWFLIITGANMAGKSTYLRTIGVNYLLACVGAPAYAKSLVVYPAKMVTSLRTSDSLVSNESYFFAELKRLKMIIDRLQQGEKLFIILDEILKGTNSIDKQKGSIALIKQLVSYKACGIIATHDLVLGTLENEFPEQIKNYRFEADIKDDELSFSYQLREGIAENMNACFLMKKMGITI